MKIEFLKSAVKPEDYPLGDRPEIALAGRSNAGKSSFLNALSGRTIAKVSSMPGKTELLNFFDAGIHYRLVDMPGYGYAARSKDSQSGWKDLVETYLMQRPSIAGVLLFIDSRREWGGFESQLKAWLATYQIPIMLVLTKADQLKRRDYEKVKGSFFKASGVKNLHLISSESREGIEELEDSLFREWIKPNLV